MKMATNMMLYWGSGSPPCWRAMLALEEKGLGGYGNKLISFANKEQKMDEITKLNPRAQVGHQYRLRNPGDGYSKFIFHT